MSRGMTFSSVAMVLILLSLLYPAIAVGATTVSASVTGSASVGSNTTVSTSASLVVEKYINITEMRLETLKTVASKYNISINDTLLNRVEGEVNLSKKYLEEGNITQALKELIQANRLIGIIYMQVYSKIPNSVRVEIDKIVTQHVMQTRLLMINKTIRMIKHLESIGVINKTVADNITQKLDHMKETLEHMMKSGNYTMREVRRITMNITQTIHEIMRKHGKEMMRNAWIIHIRHTLPRAYNPLLHKVEKNIKISIKLLLTGNTRDALRILNRTEKIIGILGSYNTTIGNGTLNIKFRVIHDEIQRAITLIEEGNITGAIKVLLSITIPNPPIQPVTQKPNMPHQNHTNTHSNMNMTNTPPNMGGGNNNNNGTVTITWSYRHNSTRTSNPHH